MHELTLAPDLLFRMLELGDVDEGDHHASDEVIHRSVRHDTQDEPGALGSANLALDRRQEA